ncbi:g2494 [Coccomyxa viridis]|uniref:G2494 protein n=1 Tax=Coccomyxa viridis TaxID=1274662 RepID=A0ABP1FPH1_9CHLO
MPIGRGNFNKKRVSAVKERKVKERVAKKHQAAKQKHNSKKLAVSGQRTGKAKKKLERAQRMSLKKAIASGEVDLDMADAVDVQEKGDN